MIGKKRSQVTVFIIIGVVIVAVVVFFFFLARREIPIGTSQNVMTDPEGYIDKCARDSASAAIDTMLPQGGEIYPAHYILYEDNKVQYLCYTNLFYKTCTIQDPLYVSHLENEISENITPVVENCFNQLKANLEKENYAVDMGSMSLSTQLLTGLVRVNIDRRFTMNKQGETKEIPNFKSAFNSPLYDLAVVAQEISNQESKYCNFEYGGFMLLYPKFRIEKKAVGSGEDSSKIYIIGDKYSGKKLNIAIRSCAFPESF